MMRYFSNNRFPRSGGDGFNGFQDFCGGIANNLYPWGGIILMFIGLAVIGLLIYLIVKGNKSVSSSSDTTAAPEQKKDTDYFVRILKESYAKGQISDEEFERKVRILRENE
ncbi:hypothetical protein J0B03_03650 [Alkalibacter rhizosphaerae]|uniref:SHOCT domain-containing protein n=1 Tax=Alkalibacter rhizosphaerae TaxID=2815577 RepID=A0A974XG71_9FIRM|nr:hypothetical protein [Alkalibacter rhizosphaerae]QSX09176.1 hypothetical protein J0B03_03650 [Alkalibacter rhizosphaerae]